MRINKLPKNIATNDQSCSLFPGLSCPNLVYTTSFKNSRVIMLILISVALQKKKNVSHLTEQMKGSSNFYSSKFSSALP